MARAINRTTLARLRVEAYFARAALVAIAVASLFLLSGLGQLRRSSAPFLTAAVAGASLDVMPEGPVRAPSTGTDPAGAAPEAEDDGDGDGDGQDSDDEASDRDEPTMAASVDVSAPGAPCMRTSRHAETSRMKSRYLEPETPPPRS